MTRANWATPLASTWVQPEIGLTFLSDMPILMALGPGVPNAGFFNQNWTSGSNADYVGAALTAAATAGQVDVANTIQMGSILGLEQVSTIVQGNGFSSAQEAMNARNIALQGIATKFVAGFIGTDTGKAAGTLQGMKGIIASYGLGAGQRVAGSAAANALSNIDAAKAACTAPGQAYILTSPKGESLIKARMRAEGYGPVTYLAQENLGGGSMLVYDGMPVFVTDQITSTTKTDFYVFKVGPAAMQLILPPTGLFQLGPDIPTANSAAIVRNIILQVQVMYNSPRSCAQVWQQTL